MEAPSTSESRSTTAALVRVDFSAFDHLRATLNQFKFGWKWNPALSLPRDSHVYLLGLKYSTETGKHSCESDADLYGNFLDFLDDYASRLWFTYREDFEPLCSDGYVPSDKRGDVSNSFTASLTSRLSKSYGSSHSQASLDSSCTTSGASEISSNHCPPPNASIPLSIQTSDSGWGCMIRSGQMLLAQALTQHLLGRNWRKYRSTHLISTSQDRQHCQLIRWFHDSWSSQSPFSIHRIIKASGQRPGSLFGPSIVCAALLKAMTQVTCDTDVFTQLHIYFSRDRVIYRKDIMQLARGQRPPPRDNQFIYADHTGNYAATADGNSNNFQRAIILLIPLRLGPGKHISSNYVSMICKVFGDPCVIGLIGGRPRHSVYVVGSEPKENKLVSLDPHYVQTVVNIQKEDFPIKSWHCRTPKVMSADKLDPSCALGFYCRTHTELRDLLERLPRLLSVPSSKTGDDYTSLIEILDD